jgi:outer membrane protein assembly factor BamB
VTHRALTLAGEVLLATIDEELVALARKDGRRLWSRPATRPQRTADGETVYTAAGPLLMALDLETGAERWRLTLPAPLHASPQLVGDRLYFGLRSDLRLYVVDRSTGRSLEPLVLAGFNGHVVAAGKILASAARNGRRQTYQIDPETGRIDLMDKGLLSVQRGVAYFDIGGGGVEAVDVSSRRSVAAWRNLATAHRGGILVSGELLYQQDLSGDAGVVHAFALADGRRLWSFRTGDWVQGSVATPEALYLSSEDCHIYAVRPGR